MKIKILRLQKIRKITWVLFTLAAYGSVSLSLAWLGSGVLLSYCIPLLLLGNFLRFIKNLGQKRWQMALFYGLLCLIGFPFWQSLVAFSWGKETLPIVLPINHWAVLTYNVHLFHYHQQPQAAQKTQQLIRWIANENSQIQCLQEFYDLDSSQKFCTVRQLVAQRPYYYLHKGSTDDFGATIGLAIFSAYPIINKGKLTLAATENPLNTCIFADIVKGKDTVRIYNVHLQSMSLSGDKTLTNSNLLKKSAIIFEKIQRSALLRATQIQTLQQHIAHCPYPFILCGDFNEIPCSATYFALKANLYNAFEEAGQGIGATYPSAFPFLRIDHQFCSPQWQVRSYETKANVPYSDHLPLQVIYQLRTTNNPPKFQATELKP